jgi:hypothetical protein
MEAAVESEEAGEALECEPHEAPASQSSEATSALSTWVPWWPHQLNFVLSQRRAKHKVRSSWLKLIVCGSLLCVTSMMLIRRNLSCFAVGSRLGLSRAPETPLAPTTGCVAGGV